MTDWVGAAFELFKQQREDADVLDSLVAEGCSRALAEKLLVFLPHACGRALLADTGVALSDNFRCMRPDGTVGPPQRLASDSDWVAIQRYVTDRTLSDKESVAIIGMRSSEFDAVNQALHNGSQLKDLVTADPIFIFTDASGLPDAIQETKPKPWWAFWR
jgi:hypothetical protein